MGTNDFVLTLPKILKFKDKKDITHSENLLKDMVDQSISIERLGFSQSNGWIGIVYTITNMPSDEQIRDGLKENNIVDIVHEKWGFPKDKPDEHVSA